MMPSSTPPTTASPSSSSTPSSPTHPFATSRKRPRVTAEHTLSRVRENQRRHRARRKDYIASLERKLAETEAQLAEARAELEELRRERSADAQRQGKDSVITERLTDTDTTLGGEFAIEMIAETAELPDLGVGSAFDALDVVPLPPLPSPSLEFATMGPPPCCIDSEPLPPARIPSPECSSCHTRPAPAPTESTTLCAQAYVLIAQQNFRGIDAATIRLWLYQGYRRARREGEGCRVENGTLFRLLDYISGV